MLLFAVVGNNKVGVDGNGVNQKLVVGFSVMWFLVVVNIVVVIVGIFGMLFQFGCRWLVVI